MVPAWNNPSTLSSDRMPGQSRFPSLLAFVQPAGMGLGLDKPSCKKPPSAVGSPSLFMFLPFLYYEAGRGKRIHSRIAFKSSAILELQILA